MLLLSKVLNLENPYPDENLGRGWAPVKARCNPCLGRGPMEGIGHVTSAIPTLAGVMQFSTSRTVEHDSENSNMP